MANNILKTDFDGFKLQYSLESVGFMNTEQIYGLCKDGLFVHTLNYCFEKVFGL